MYTIDLEKMKASDDGWKFLSESSPVFEEKVNCFLRNASYHVNVKNFNIDAIDMGRESDVVHLETHYYGSRKFALSYNSGIRNRDLDCQYRLYRRIEFTLDANDNLVIKEMSGRLESKYGYNFENTKGGMFKTNYSYQVFTKEGIELLYRGYSDQSTIKEEDFYSYDRNLGVCTRVGYNPVLENINDNKYGSFAWSKHTRFTELSRSLDNLGLVKEVVFNGNHDELMKNQDVEYHLNTFMTDKHDIDPYLIHINRGILPIAYVKDGKLAVNYAECGVTKDNYQNLAKFRFATGAEEKMQELQSELGELPKDDLERRAIIGDLIGKYHTLSQMYEIKKGTRRTK